VIGRASAHDQVISENAGSSLNLIERFFNRIKQRRRGATRYDKLAANHLSFIKLVSIRIRLRADESPVKTIFANGSTDGALRPFDLLINRLDDRPDRRRHPLVCGFAYPVLPDARLRICTAGEQAAAGT
jgi:hypothetical protein